MEEQRAPSLIGKPFAVGGRPEQRGVVSSCSYAARASGVRSAMPMRTALGLCPNLLIVSSHFTAYRAASRQVMNRLRDLTPLVEQISIDEAFLDVTDLSDPVKEISHRLQDGIRQNLGLPCSLGAATNKLVAKIATDVGKIAVQKGVPPTDITLGPSGDAAECLATLPVSILWGGGPKTAERLALMEITEIGELAQISEVEMVRRFKKVGYDLLLRAKGIDNRSIVTEHEAKSISQEVTYSKDTTDIEKLRRTLQNQSQNIARQLAKKGLTARNVKMKLRWSDFTTLTRQTTPGQPFDDGDTIAQNVIELLEKEWGSTNRQPVRLIGVGVSGLENPPQQMGLWDRDWKKDEKLRAAIEDLQERFGEDALSRGAASKESISLS